MHFRRGPEQSIIHFLATFSRTFQKLKGGSNLFQVSIRFHPCHSWQLTAVNSFSVAAKSVVTKLRHYLWASADVKTKIASVTVKDS